MALRQRRQVGLFIALEMGQEEIEQRNIARDCNFNSIQFLKRDKPKLVLKVGEYAVNVPNNTVFEDMPGGTFDELRAVVLTMIAVAKIKVIVVDYWQIIGGKSSKDTEEYHMRKVAQWLADTARREGVAILISAQVNKDGNTRGGEGLKLACDQYYTLHREKGSKEAWLEMEESRYTLYKHVGSEDVPGLLLDRNGPHFKDLVPDFNDEEDEEKLL